MTLHDLRHFYASALIAAGCDVVAVQRALGHAKATTTLSTYRHLWPTAEDRTRAAAADLMAAARTPADSLRTEQARHRPWPGKTRSAYTLKRNSTKSPSSGAGHADFQRIQDSLYVVQARMTQVLV